MATSPTTPRLIVVGHDIRSLANVGTLFRSCDGAGVSELVLSGVTGTPPDRRIDKVALDAVDMVPWRSTPDRAELERVLEGRFVVVLEQHERAETLGSLTLPLDQDVVLIACEELFGATEWLIERADAVLELPMRGQKHSLNVAVAASIAMYSFAEQLWGTGDRDLLSRRPDQLPVREGVLTRGVTQGQQRAEVPEARMGTRLE
ncbi:MAG: TrmH family RNA methyltransferase [Gaiellales bacterium]